MLLSLYRTASVLGGPLIAAGLRRRLRRDKEDAVRLGERFGHASLERPDGPLVWLHAASVGESLSALPLIEALLATAPVEVLLTTGTTSSARLMAQRLPPRTRHQFAPIDRPDAWRRFLDHWRPEAALLIESELWPNLILETRARRIPMALINGRMSARSYRRWRRLPGAARHLLAGFALCLAQSVEDQKRLAALGAPEVRHLGNLKRAAPPLPVDAATLEPLRRAIGGRPVWLAASTHPGEDEQILGVHTQLAAELPELVTVIAPRHAERGDELAQAARARGAAVAQRGRGEPIDPRTGVYIADTLGELGLFFRLADLAFIGGSLIPHGGHNPLEAARLGCPAVFGPHTDNFHDLCAHLLQRGAALRVADAAELGRSVAALLREPARRDALARRARAAAEAEADVLKPTLEAVLALLERAVASRHARP